MWQFRNKAFHKLTGPTSIDSHHSLNYQIGEEKHIRIDNIDWSDCKFMKIITQYTISIVRRLGMVVYSITTCTAYIFSFTNHTILLITLMCQSALHVVSITFYGSSSNLDLIESNALSVPMLTTLKTP